MRLNVLVRTLLAALVGTTLSLAQQPSAARISPESVPGNANYGRLPLTFEANRGQTDGKVNFLSRGIGYTAFLTTDGMVLSLRPASVANQTSASSQQPINTTLQFRLLGASKRPVAVGEDPQPGRVNYFIGNDPAQWRTNVPTYKKVRYKNVYPGIDLIYYGNHQQLEYDFAVVPGADPRQIQFEVQGANHIQIDNEGNLILTTGAGELRFQSPIVYQEANGRRIPLGGGYAMQDAMHIGFQVAHYDSSKPLVIDPVLAYSTYVGGSGTDQPTGIAVDSSGSVYLAGYTDSANFPLATLGTLPSNTNHVFVTKLDAAGTNLLYTDYIGGNNQDYGLALVLDSADEVYVTGSTESSNFPAVNAYQAQQPGPYSGFLSKVSADGASLLYSTYLGGNTFDQATSIAIDSLGQATVAGYTASKNFPVANAYQSTVSANQGGNYGIYGFLTKFSPNGSSLVYSTYLAGNSNVAQMCGSSSCWPSPYNAISAVAVDANGNAYITGTTNTYNFPATSGSYQASNTAQQNATVGFLSKFSSTGSLDYSTYFYPSSGDAVGPTAIAVDGSGSAYITGVAESDGTFPITSTSICNPGVVGFECSYAFVTKFSVTGSTLLYSTFLGPNNFASPQSIALDANDDAYILAATQSAAFAETNGIESYSSGSDLVLVEIDPAATTQLFATYLGGSGNEQPAGLAVDSSANIYVAGATNSTDLPTTTGAFQTVAGGNTDAFIAKIGAAAAPSVSLSPNALQFAILPVGSTSQPQTVVLRNMGSSSLLISSITTNGDFAETNNCGSGVSAESSCTFSITFTPTAPGYRSGSIVIQDNAAGSPHSIALNDIVSGANVALTPSSLIFPSEPVGVSSGSQAVTLTNSGNASLSISSIQVTGDYHQTNNCPAALAASSSCTITIVFTPTLTGTRSGTLTVSDNASSSPQALSLTGAGSDFSLATSPSQNTVQPGSAATYTVTVASIGGAFSNAVSLSCSGLPAQVTCSFSPGAVTPGASSATSTLTISTTTSAQIAAPEIPIQKRPIQSAWLQLQGVGLFGLVLSGSKKRSRRMTIFVILALLVLGMLLMTGCAGGTGIAPQSQPPSQTYTIMVIGTSGALQHSQPVNLTVQ